jgi:hypothetical protein
MNRAAPLLVAVLLALPAALTLLASESYDRFPHDIHEGLFPLGCPTCHGGIADLGAPGAYTVTPAECARCHDGVERNEVPWRPPEPAASNLVFDHRLHVGEMEIECADCHGEGMEVERIDQEACFECHGIEDHYEAGNDCATCHLPLTEAPGLAVAALPAPESHQDPGFLFAHGAEATADAARCATCHSRDQCEVCHLNASALAPVQALEPDARMAALVAGREGKWPEPASHREEGWVFAHGEPAHGADCANCHTPPGCRECHGEVDPGGISALFPPREGGPAGIGATGAYPPRHGPGFDRDHAFAATSGELDCASCHLETECDDCHDAARRPGFHLPNFMARHAAEASARDMDCASCHSNEVFCRSCHIQSGLSPEDPVNASYHDGQPDWILQHGDAARVSMETCASCHQQNDCLRCHSSHSGWGVNPHGPGFDADRLGDRADVMCRSCHSGGAP